MQGAALSERIYQACVMHSAHLLWVNTKSQNPSKSAHRRKRFVGVVGFVRAQSVPFFAWFDEES